MVVVREVKRRLREALGVDWKVATVEQVAHLVLVELTLLHVAELGEAGHQEDARRFLAEASRRALAAVDHMGLPEDAPAQRDTEAVAAEFVEALRLQGRP